MKIGTDNNGDLWWITLANILNCTYKAQKPGDLKMKNETTRLPSGGAWMEAFYVLPCTDTSAHFKQDDRLLYAAEGENVEVSYTNALYCGVYPCFISEAVDVDTTCFTAAWPDESFELMQLAGGLINRALLAYHRGLTDLKLVSLVSDYVKGHITGIRTVTQWEIFRPLMPILNWEPAPGGADALARLQPLFPPAPPAQPEG